MAVAVHELKDGVGLENIAQAGGIIPERDVFVVLRGWGDVKEEEVVDGFTYPEALSAGKGGQQVGCIKLPVAGRERICLGEIYLGYDSHAAAVVVVGADKPIGCAEIACRYVRFVGRDGGQ